MSDQTDQIKADVQALQAAATAAGARIANLTDYALSLEEGAVTDEQFAALHDALTQVTDELNQAVEDSVAALPPPEPGREDA